MPEPSGDLSSSAWMRRVGANIRRHRKAVGITQEKLAEAAHLSTYFIGSVERGQASLSLRSLYVIANALKVPLHVLIDSASDGDRELLRRQIEARLRKLTLDELRSVLELVLLISRRWT